MAVEIPPRSIASTRRHSHGVTNALHSYQAPERALCDGSAAGIAHIGDHEGHVGDVAGAEQEIADQVDQHRFYGEFRGSRIGNSRAGPDWRQQQRQRQDHRQQRHRPPHDPPRPGPNACSVNGAIRPDARIPRPGQGIKQAEQKIRALGLRLRDGCRERGAADGIRRPRPIPPAAAQNSK